MSQKFKSKKSFILASIGAAVGLGNALRFPGLCAKYGGGAFLLIYFISLVVLGLPLLNAEIALGRKFKGAAPVCMSALTPKKPRLGGAVGWAACFNSLLTAVIYAGLAGWIISTVIFITPLSVAAPDLTQSQISSYFFDSVLEEWRGVVFASIIAAWAAMFFCLKGGARALARAAEFTVVIPVILLVVLACRGLIYSNSGEALSKLFIPDFSALASAELWLTALGQVFFSLSVAVGIMPAFGSCLPEGVNIFSCSVAVAAADFLVSVLASVVMFTTLYGCGLESEIGSSGIITAFTVYPVAITRLFGHITGLNAILGVLFYSSLAMMAVQSAVSMAEAFLAPFAGNKIKKKLVICLICGGVSLIFATPVALKAVEISDKIINFYNVLILGIAECVILSFSKRTDTLADEINRFTCKIKMPEKFFCVSVKFLCPLILILLCVIQFTAL